MRVSVIIPVYNEEGSIKECLESLERQKYPDFEVIVVDDGSKDRTKNIVQSAEGKYRKYKLKMVEQKHGGAGAARNLGAKHARGEVLVFVDADMTFGEMFLKELVAPIVAGKAVGTTTRAEYVSNWDNRWARCWNYNENMPEGKRHKGKSGELGVYRAIKRSVFNEVGGFEPGGYDDDLSLRAKFGQDPVETKARLYHKNPQSLGEVFRQARWAGKRSYKLGSLGVGYALVRVSLPVGLIVGITKSLYYRCTEFVVFKLVYNSGASLGILSYHIKGQGGK